MHQAFSAPEDYGFTATHGLTEDSPSPFLEGAAIASDGFLNMSAIASLFHS